MQYCIIYIALSIKIFFSKISSAKIYNGRVRYSKENLLAQSQIRHWRFNILCGGDEGVARHMEGTYFHKSFFHYRIIRWKWSLFFFYLNNDFKLAFTLSLCNNTFANRLNNASIVKLRIHSQEYCVSNNCSLWLKDPIAFLYSYSCGQVAFKLCT